GSTGTPKGVKVTHANLSLCCRDLLERWPYDEPHHHVSWLPTFHDMGLIWGLMMPLSGGLSVTFMPPGTSLQRPARWRGVITRCRGTTPAAPNFAYGLCVRKLSAVEYSRLDLSSMRYAVNGAE